MRRILPILISAARTSARRFIPPGVALRARHVLTAPEPHQMIIDICATCNALCPFCPRVSMPPERSKGVMADYVFDSCVAEAKQHGIRDIRLYSTAEPTLHPKFDEIVTRLKTEGFEVTVSTNAWTLTKHVESLGKIDRLQYSIEGWDKESYEKFRYPLKFDRIRTNLEIFWNAAAKLARRPRITCNLLLTRDTDIQMFVDCWGPFVDEITMNFLMGTTIFKNGRFITENNAEIGDDYYAYDTVESGTCGYPFDVVTVAYDGKIALCCEDFSAEMPLGRIEDGVDRVWQMPELKNIRGQFYSGRLDVCSGCNFFRRPLQADVDAVKARIAALPEAARRKVAFAH